MKRNRQNDIVRRLDQLDARVAAWMARHGVRFVRASLGIVLLWFGLLKLFPELSPAEELAGRTIMALTGGLIEPAIGVPVLGIWEALIGIGLLSGRALRLTLVLLFVQMSGTVTPLILFPGEIFVREPFVLTLVGQYIVKNVVLVSAAIVVGATVRGGRLKAEATGEFARPDFLDRLQLPVAPNREPQLVRSRLDGAAVDQQEQQAEESEDPNLIGPLR